jgi:hypothetical protein
MDGYVAIQLKFCRIFDLKKPNVFYLSAKVQGIPASVFFVAINIGMCLTQSKHASDAPMAKQISDLPFCLSRRR